MTAHTFTIDVHIHETDCYGVMWHGSYHKWLEQGRVDLFKQIGITLAPPHQPTPEEAANPTPDQYVYPVVEQTIQYRAAARLNDRLHFETKVHTEGHKLIFDQVVTKTGGEDDGQTVIIAKTSCLVLDYRWRPQRHLAARLKDYLTPA